MEIIPVWLIASALVAWVAAQRGRGSIAWFLISLLLSPILGILLLIACPVVIGQNKTIPWTKSHTLALISFACGIAGFAVMLSLLDAHPDAAMAVMIVNVAFFVAAIAFIWTAWSPTPGSPSTTPQP